MKRTLIFCVYLFSLFSLPAQEKLGVLFTFDDCEGTATGDIIDSARVEGGPSCDCGVMGNALLLDGNNDRVLLPDTLRAFFKDDFTVSFYFTMDNVDGNINLFSYRTTCDQDSSFEITYTVSTNDLRVEFAKELGEIFEISGPLDLTKCWHQVVVTKFKLEYSIYINGELVESIQANREIPFGKNANISLANSPCLLFFEDRIAGKIDELEILNYALSPGEIGAAYLAPDRIITPNTTVFEGESVLLESGPTCAININWSPAVDLDDPNIKEPLLTARETTKYSVAFDNGNCISRDTVLINVVDPENLMCSDLLVPRAFTPNNDGINEIFHISNKFLVEELISFEIYDRSSTLLYSTSNLDEGWDGSFRGQPVNPGIFMYKITYRCGGQDYNKIDNFTVLR